jgi:recombination protein RecA
MTFANLSALSGGVKAVDKLNAVNVIPTAYTKFNQQVLRTGGIPFGRVTQIWGPEHAGKSLLVYHLIAMAQKLRPTKAAVLVDTEMTFDAEFARLNGVDLDRLVVFQSNAVDETLGRVLQAIETGEISFVAIDSLGNVDESDSNASEAFAKKTVKGLVVDKHATIPGQFAKQMTKFVKKLTPVIVKHDVAFVATNQMREKIGVLYGPTDDYPGGHSWKHAISLSLKVRKVTDIKDGPDQVPYGVKVAISVIKNKLAPCGKTDDSSHLDFYFTEDGVERAAYGSLYNDAIEKGVLLSKGAWLYLMDGEKRVESWNGKAKCQDAIMQDAKLRDTIATLIAGVNEQPTSGVPESILEDS